MKNFLLAGAMLLGTLGTALAGEGNGEPFPFTGEPFAVVGSPPSRDVGSNQYPDFGNTSVAVVTAGGVLPVAGSEAPVQTANSLPPHFSDGTPAVLQAQAAQRYFAAQAARAGVGAASAGDGVPVVAGNAAGGSKGPVQHVGNARAPRG